MKKSNFLEGAFIATIGIIICKILGLLYVIPFYSMVGSQGGALYSYAYSIYAIFLSLSTSGIPIAISKLVSEYQTLQYQNSKERVYKIGLLVISLLSFVLFLLMMISAPTLAHLILGNLNGGNTVQSVTMVIRIISTSLLIVPIFSVTKGYLQGHQMMDSVSKANIVEQLIRVAVILFGSLFALKVFHASINTAVGVAVFGATVGAMIAYLYLGYKIFHHKEELYSNAKITRNEAKITNKVIIKKIIFYAFPFLAIDLCKSAFSLVDTFTVVKTLTKLGYEATLTESVIGVLNTWGTKLNMIVISIALGISMSLVPNIASSYIKRDMIGVSTKMKEALQSLLFFALPMVFGLSFLATPVWTIFYGADSICSSIFSVFIFQALTFSCMTILLNIIQTMNDTKTALGSLLFGFLMKMVLNVPIMYLCKIVDIPSYYGPSMATIFAQSLVIIIIIYQLKNKHGVLFENTFHMILKIVLSTLIMYMSLKIVGRLIPIHVTSRGIAILTVLFYTILGLVIYGIVVIKQGILKQVLSHIK